MYFIVTLHTCNVELNLTIIAYFYFKHLSQWLSEDTSKVLLNKPKIADTRFVVDFLLIHQMCIP